MEPSIEREVDNADSEEFKIRYEEFLFRNREFLHSDEESAENLAWHYAREIKPYL